MKFTQTRIGEAAILTNEVVWGLFPIITILSFSHTLPIVSLAWSTLIACVFFAVIVVVKGKIYELLRADIYKHVIIVAFFIGWLYYGFYFSGLQFTSAGNASIIALMELFFSFLLFNVWHGEEFPLTHTFGAILMLLGALIILFPHGSFSFHGGDLLVLSATVCAPMGNFYQQKLRKKISSESILFLRSLFTFPFIFIIAFFMHAHIGWQAVHNSFWLLLVNGLLALGVSKLLWLEGIHRISVTKATALGSVAPPCTLFFAYLFLHQSPSLYQFAAFFPLSIGLILLTVTRAKKIEV